jgi:tRNA (guanine37-N1)-methyltransferase
MNYTVITLLPELLDVIRYGVLGKALERKLITLNCINPRDFAVDKHGTVDDAAYGGGPGMVMMAEPLSKAIIAAKAAHPESKVVYLSPQGKRFDQTAAKQFATESGIIFVAGRYEGIDQRVIDELIDEEWSIGDFVITGGEMAASVMIDAITRMLPDVVGDRRSVTEDTFYNGRLKYPQYTRPKVYRDKAVPKVLQSGDHEAIATWRLKQSLGNTWLKRPDLLEEEVLSDTETTLLNEFIDEHKQQ